MNKGKRLEERIEAVAVLEEAVEGKPRRIRFEKAMTADIVNGNGRRYPSAVLEAAIAELRSHLNESAGQGRAIQVLGEAEHPSDKPTRRPNLLETVVKWEEVNFDGRDVTIVGRVLETSKGKDILTLMEGGVMPGVSMRGYGEGKTIGKGDEKVFEVTELHITGFDPVLEPSFENVAQLVESQNQSSMEDDMSEELLTKLQEQEQEKAELNKKLEEAQKKIAEGEKAQAQIAEAKAKADIENAITEALKDLPFGEKLNEMFSEALKEGEYASPEAVKKFAESLRKQYSKFAASKELKKMGFSEGKGLQVLGDVLENETGTPEFARASFEIVESIRKNDHRAKRTMDLRAESPAQIFTRALLERFDGVNKQQLIMESRMLQEAELTTDLNIPYSVSRAMIEEAFPNLVAANIFDVGVINTSPTRLYFEATTGESGYTASVSDEEITGGAEGVWYDLAHGRITPDSVTVTSNPAGTTYDEGDDYVIDYAAGRIKFLTQGDIGTNDVLVDYTYTAIRQGEMQPIERAKTTLSYMTIEAAADRLADAISREAVVFSQSQLGWDAPGRTMTNLVKQMRRKIDQGLLYWAFSAVKAVANNSTTAWTVGTEQADLAELVQLMGNANVIVANRFYEPTFYLMSVTNADRLSNWEGFMRDGFPNAFLNAAGFAGMVKGKPVFASTEFPDSLVIAGNRELVAHRVFQPLTIKGPFPIYAASGDVTRLIAGEQYYAEEFNVTESPVNEKGAYVPISSGS